MEVGAGTSPDDLPARVRTGADGDRLRTAFRRPTDGRYGENPNRLQHYYQFRW